MSSSCVFTEFRDKIQFEDFENNHPAIYLSFVCYNWLAMGILPNLYKNEPGDSEINRVKILQKDALVLKVLEIIINSVLNINIKLDKQIYHRNVELLEKKQSSLTRDSVLPYLAIENYMTQLDSALFIDTLSLYYPDTVIITKSTDAIPCSEFYEMISDKIVGVNIWGPAYWKIIHYTAYILDLVKNNPTKEKYIDGFCSLTGFIDYLLPCSFCRYHYASLNDDSGDNEETYFPRPFPITLPYIALYYAKENKLFDFFYKLHENCKLYPSKTEPLGMEYYKRINKNFKEMQKN